MSIIQRLRANPWVVLVVLCLGLFMALLDTTIVNVAVPSIIEGIDASFDEILWVLNAYVLVFAALLITSGRLGEGATVSGKRPGTREPRNSSVKLGPLRST